MSRPVPNPLPHLTELSRPQTPQEPNLPTVYLPFLVGLTGETGRLGLLYGTTRHPKLCTQPIRLSLIKLNKLRYRSELDPPRYKKRTIVQSTNLVMSHAVGVAYGKGKVSRGGLTVADQVRGILIVWHQQLLLGFISFQFAKVPPVAKEKRSEGSVALQEKQLMIECTGKGKKKNQIDY